MICFINIQKKTFEDELFQGENPRLIENEDKNEYKTISEGNYHIKTTYFHDITSTSQGSAFF